MDHLLAVVDRLQATGVRLERLDPLEPAGRCTVKVTSERRLKPALFTTQPYPGFPTDIQAQMMTLLCFADGNSIGTEKIFPDRFLHVSELTRMGALVYRQGGTVVVQGVNRLVGAPVMASDLRGSASLVLAGLAAEGVTTISRIYHLDRGYSDSRINSMNWGGHRAIRCRCGGIEFDDDGLLDRLAGQLINPHSATNAFVPT